MHPGLQMKLIAWAIALAAAGLPTVGGAPDSVLFSPGVDVRFGPRLGSPGRISPTTDDRRTTT